ncbi:protein enabled-like isoform X3 [Artemia franciscana]|uniref:WH1 domain-containing protein n=1 Tax=Artemia franciscana TaxID=6661 RepID=A0AA88H8L2_ARTSF|nr:hypothetical protein QYM36_014818 [Artemia franciscana]KAK2706914.1 hypothetical protein QYM36_014818 [Artemia franciscana]KAK2706916.1 hypothetical protein QYM36_014818 [Artemia franciscana]
MSEVSLAAARAAVMVYDDANKKWIPSGSSSGLSKVHVYHHTINNTFRVVGRKLHDHEVVINCALLKGLKYNQATPTFHQWRDNKQVYGLNFSSKDDADGFASAMLRAIEVINGHIHRPAPAPPVPSIPQISSSNQLANQNSHHQQQQQNVYQTVNNGYDEDNYSRAREESAPNTMERRSSQNSLGALNHSVSTPAMQQTPPTVVSPSQSGHHRASSAPNPPQAMSTVPQPPLAPPQGVPVNQGPPPPPPAPPQFGGPPMAPPPQFANPNASSPASTPSVGGPPAPPPPPMPSTVVGPPAPPPAPPIISAVSSAPPASTGGPPPPPPMMPVLNRQNSGMEPNSLVHALQNVRLKKSAKSVDSGTSSSSSSSAGSTYGTIGKGGSERPSLSGAGIGSMMDEMQRTLARRRAQAERQDTTSASLSQDESDRKYNTIATTNGRLNNGNAESPKSGRKRLGSSGDEASPRVTNGKAETGSLDLESIKQEIIKEVRKEIQKAKLEIIDAIRLELSRR